MASRFRPHTGFTLVELLIVVVVIGIIASLVLLRYGDIKSKTYESAMLNDLRNFAVEAELMMDDTGQYPSDPENTPGFAFSDKVSVLSYSADASSWQIAVQHAATDKTCDLAGGSGSTFEGRAVCSEFTIAASDESPDPGTPVTLDASPAVAQLAAAALPGTPLYGASLSDLSRIDWNFGDGSDPVGGDPATYVTVEHTYAEAGSFTVVLTLTKTGGEVRNGKLTLSVGGGGSAEPPAENQAPAAAFEWSPMSNEAGSTVTFSSQAGDPDGSIVGYEWSIAGTTYSDAGATQAYLFAGAGTFSVTLTVTDNGGLTDSATQSITITEANVAPVASFTMSASSLEVGQTLYVDGSASSDADGTIDEYAWGFGPDVWPQPSSSTTQSNTFNEAGVYEIYLEVRDNLGGIGFMVDTVTVFEPAPTTWDEVQNTTVDGDGTSITFTGATTYSSRARLYQFEGIAPGQDCASMSGRQTLTITDSWQIYAYTLYGYTYSFEYKAGETGAIGKQFWGSVRSCTGGRVLQVENSDLTANGMLINIRNLSITN